VANKYVFKCRLNVDSDGDDVTNDGRPFHAWAAATGKARSPSCCDESLEQRQHRRWRAGTQTPPRGDVSRALDVVGKVRRCCVVETPEDEGRQLERDPLRNSKPVELMEQWHHVIELPGTEYDPSSGVED